MDVMFSYFEPIGKCLNGYCDPNPRKTESGKYFKLGVKAVFSSLDKLKDQTAVDDILELLWKGVRCGLYHTGQVKGSIAITGDVHESIRVDLNASEMVLNPHLLILDLTRHLDQYRDNLLAVGPTG